MTASTRTLRRVAHSVTILLLTLSSLSAVGAADDATKKQAAGTDKPSSQAAGTDKPSSTEGDAKELSKRRSLGKKKRKDYYIFSTAKLPKRIEEAPAIITSYDQDYLRDFGLRTLNELLEITPGFDQRTASWFDTPATRGMPATSLLLIDGTPINSHVTNLYPAGYGLDITNYKRIEVTAGPGGVLWGAYSLLGLINLITISGGDIDGVRGRVELGSFGHQRYSVKAGKRWGDYDALLSVNVLTRRNAGALVNQPTQQTTTFGGRFLEDTARGGLLTNNKSDYSIELLGRASYKYFTLFARIPFSKQYFQQSDQGGYLDFNDNGWRQSDDWLIYASYVDSYFDDHVSALAKVYYYRNVLRFNNRLWSANPSYPNGFGSFSDQGNAFKLGSIVELAWRWNVFRFLSSNLIVGVDGFWEAVRGATVSISDENGIYGTPERLIQSGAQAFTISAYVNEELRFFDRVVLSGGARVNANDTYATKLLLSGSIVARIWGRTFAKFNIIQGLRPPTMGQRFGFEPESAPLGDYQDPNAITLPMAPAVSTSWQVELNSKILENVGPISAFFLRGNVALTSVDNIKQLEPSSVDTGTQYYLPRINRNILSTGGRLDTEWLKNYRVWASYFYNKVSLPAVSDFKLPQVGPRHTMQLGASVRIFRHITLMMRGMLQTNVTRLILNFDPSQPLGGQAVKTTAPPLGLLNAGIIVDRIYRDLQLTLAGYNLLDARYSHYVFTNVFEGSSDSGQSVGQAAFFQRPGINVMFTAKMTVK